MTLLRHMTHNLVSKIRFSFGKSSIFEILDDMLSHFKGNNIIFK